MKIGVMFGSPETTTGGRALKFYASVRLDVRRIETLKDGREMVRQPYAGEGGQKQSGSHRSSETSSIFFMGAKLSREGSLIDLGVDTGIIRTAWSLVHL